MKNPVMCFRSSTVSFREALQNLVLPVSYSTVSHHRAVLHEHWASMSWNRLPLARKVGEVPEYEDKFASWSGTHGYYTRPDTVPNPFKTDKMLNSAFDKSKLVENVTLCTTLRELNKSQVEFKPRTATDAKIMSRSSSHATFVDQRTMSAIMRERGTVDNFYCSFERVSCGWGSSGEDVSVPVKHVGAVVNDCLGSDAPEFIVDKFIELCNRNSAGGRITWSRFRAIIPTVVAAVEAECKFRRELPALMVLMNRPRIEDKNLGSLGDMSSTYRDNFNARHDLRFADDHPGFAYTKAIEPTNKKGLNNAAQVLYAGTTKCTYHLPGYKGHVPANVRNHRKLEHSCGEISHPVANNLRLTQRGMGCVLGYTGHVPHETSGPRQERTTACDPRTTNGASFGKTRAFL